MKKQGIGRKLTAVLLTLVMLLSLLPATALAAKGDMSTDVSTGLDGNIDTSDTISLPIQIMDYESDGMLFEFAEAYANNTDSDTTNNAKTASDFGATWYEDYTIRTSVGGNINKGNYWSNVSLALKTGTYANYTRATWAGNTTANWTGNRAGVVLADFSESSTYTTDQVRYMVVVFRSNVRSGNFTVGLNRANLNGAGTNGNYTGNIAVTTENNTNWTYAVLDLKTGTLGSNWSKGAVYGVYVGLPIDASGEWMDIAHLAFFSDKEQATAFGEYALTDGSDRGDNRGFGLLRGSRNQDDNGSSTNAYGSAYAGIMAKTSTLKQFSTYGDTTSIDYTTATNLGYTLLGTFGDAGIANIGLLESGLSDKGYPVYKQEVVEYLAGLLKHSLEISERTSDGWKNYRYIDSEMADMIRNAVDDKTGGSYAAAKGKNLVGAWADVSGNISSYYDAAYFLLNSIFVPGSYNTEAAYDYLVLSAGTDSTKKVKTYVFDAGFVNTTEPKDSTAPAVKYDTTAGTIQNTDATGKARFYYNGTSATTLNPFLPLSGTTKNTYYQDDGVIQAVKGQTTQDTILNRNYSYALKSEGEFVYHADDELFFEFEGDDDVYLFINDELVLDNGSAHSINIVRINVNEYVNKAKANELGSAERNKALALEEGQTCTFKFYYLERHSYGANLRISTNIKVTDPTMATTKTAWQSDTQLDYGSIVDKDKVVEYGFAITNSGEEKLFNLSFTDNAIGVTLSPEKGLAITGSRVYDVNGEKLTASDLTAIVSHPDYDDITVKFADNDALKTFLKNLTASGTEENGGLYLGATVTIRGIGYKLSAAEINAGVFDNTVLTAATNKTESKTLQSQASMRVFVPADPMYYEWAGHDLKIEKAKLINDILAAAGQSDNILAGKVPDLAKDGADVNKIELVTKAGNAISSPYVAIDKNNNLTVNYDTAGSKVFYVKVTYDTSKTVVVPVLVNVTNVTDSVYVLDYGLKVDLTANSELTKNDAITVPGRTTKSDILAIGSGGTYGNPVNEITFSTATPVTGTYGDFAYNDGTIVYTPNGQFLEGLDTVQVALNVYESSITPSKISGALDINKEVEMYKNITVLPANVVYYEDCFPAITYTGDKTQTNSFSALGSQSNDQDAPYGSDDYYDDDANESAGSLTTIAISSAETKASFTFTGTGFELIGRTNASDSATLIVRVKDSAGTTVKTIPVITQFDNNNDGGTEEIYQVPVIRVKDLALGAYTVEISGVPAFAYDENGNKIGTKTTKLYVDGLRIFQPLEDQSNYDDDEKNATFVEIRNLIVDGLAGVAAFNGELVEFSSSLYTWTENLEAKVESLTEPEVYDVHQVETVDEYLLKGPNNELYMYGEATDQALILYVKENSSTAHALQVGVRAIDRGMFFVGSPANDGIAFGLCYGTKTDAVGWTVIDTVKGSTEQYYTVDYKNCPVVTINGTNYYQVAIKATSGLAAFTSVKYVGLDLAEVVAEEGVSNLVFVEGTLYTPEDTQSYANLSKLSEQMRSNVVNESVPVDEDGLVTAPGGNDDEGSIPVVMGRPGYEDMIAQLLAN